MVWQRLGVYRTLPIFFLAGAALEWFMINVRVGKETFCELYIDLQIQLPVMIVSHGMYSFVCLYMYSNVAWPPSSGIDLALTSLTFS